ncbi:hypothetical protein CEXT_345051 [Caerostris extrusa]|uniref:Uncharacterized protein n=1 Tax=Caerostris extrusa TaxID=172846 RepID=A0AAV4PEF2_CAEEX|nr:hypothetical protein CEXT_345051 [Caerostris extrusa]
MNRTSTFQSSTFRQSTDQERHWDVNSTAGTDVRYASSNTIQNENFDYFNSSQGLTFPAAAIFENSYCTSGVENPAMAFSSTSPSNYLTIYESTDKNYNISMNMESRQSCIPNFEAPRFPEYDAVAIARKSDRTMKTMSCATDLNSASINVEYPKTLMQKSLIIWALYSLYPQELIR